MPDVNTVDVTGRRELVVKFVRPAYPATEWRVLVANDDRQMDGLFRPPEVKAFQRSVQSMMAARLDVSAACPPTPVSAVLLGKVWLKMTREQWDLRGSSGTWWRRWYSTWRRYERRG